MPRFFFWTLSGFAVVGVIVALIFFQLPVSIHVRVAENGGFMPSVIKARAGEPLKLRLVSDDVEHTFAVGQDFLKPVLLKPNTPVYLTLTFDKAGTYAFYSTTPSSVNFWRIRGAIEVSGDAPVQPAEPPLYVRLDFKFDEAHEAEGEHIQLSRKPSAPRGAAFFDKITSAYLLRDYYVAHSPTEAFKELRAESALQSLSAADVWDVVAYIWRKNTSSDALVNGLVLYQTNCAACHGVNGAGDGRFANEMKSATNGFQAPTDFATESHLLEEKTALTQGLILRGGMGTGMPMWGTIFTDAQTWDVVAHLYSFQFDYQGVDP
jgi:mono/diheme cytochrome c family protein/plastocyanin